MKNVRMLTVALAATISASASAQMLPPVGSLLPDMDELSLTDLLNEEQYQLGTLPLNRPLYWSPARLAAGALPTEARCNVGPTVTAYPTLRVGSYAECVIANFPDVHVEDDVPDVKVPVQAGQVRGRKIYTCTKGNFRGEVEVSYGLETRPGYYGTQFAMRTHRYRIIKSNGQQGGNKANINIGARTNQHSGSWMTARSPDSMIQNGQWYDLNITSWREHTAPYYFSEIEFVFDKSGKDPKCKTNDNWIPAAGWN